MKEEGNYSILIVDDEYSICNALSGLMKSEGYLVFTAQTGEEGLKFIRENSTDLLFLDYQLPGMDGMEILKEVKRLDTDIPVIMMTGYANVPRAVAAMKAGADDYLAKPFDSHEVIRVAHRAINTRDLQLKLKDLSSQLNGKLSLGRLMGPSEKIGRLIDLINRVANSPFSVIVQGETGSGKELVANAVHRSSKRANGPFVAVDCGAIPETLLESELFGHEKGSFTGAVGQKEGKFQLADKGTLFLDEILNLPLSSQAKLLRAIQEKQIFPVGGVQPRKVDVRIIAASNLDLEDCVRKGRFRQDLFYRLNEFKVEIPPLRERREDISYLAERFLDTTNLELGKSVSGFSADAMKSLISYEWPGNVRELQSVIRRSVLMADNEITEKCLNLPDTSNFSDKDSPGQNIFTCSERSLKEIIHEHTLVLEKKLITSVLGETGGNKARAARILKIDYKTLHNKIRKLGIQ